VKVGKGKALKRQKKTGFLRKGSAKLPRQEGGGGRSLNKLAVREMEKNAWESNPLFGAGKRETGINK